MRYGIVSGQHHEKVKKSAKEIQHIVEHPPEGWAKYAHEKNGLFDIIAMEYAELMAAKSTRPHGEIVTALKHLAAASKNALDKMTCN